MGAFKIGDRVVKVTKSHTLDGPGGGGGGFGYQENEAKQFSRGTVDRHSTFGPERYGVLWDESRHSTIHTSHLMLETEFDGLDQRVKEYLKAHHSAPLSVGDTVRLLWTDALTGYDHNVGEVAEISKRSTTVLNAFYVGDANTSDLFFDWELEKVVEPETEESLVLTLTLEEAKIIQKVLAALTRHIDN